MEQLQEAIAKQDCNEIIRLYDFCESEIYKALILSDLDKLLVKATPDLCSHLSMLFYGYEYSEVYNKLYLINELRMAIKSRSINIIYKLTNEQNTTLITAMLADNLDYLLEANHIIVASSIACYFYGTEYQTEYRKLCRFIDQKLATDQNFPTKA